LPPPQCWRLSQPLSLPPAMTTTLPTLRPMLLPSRLLSLLTLLTLTTIATAMTALLPVALLLKQW